MATCWSGLRPGRWGGGHLRNKGTFLPRWLAARSPHCDREAASLSGCPTRSKITHCLWPEPREPRARGGELPGGRPPHAVLPFHAASLSVHVEGRGRAKPLGRRSWSGSCELAPPHPDAGLWASSWVFAFAVSSLFFHTLSSWPNSPSALPQGPSSLGTGLGLPVSGTLLSRRGAWSPRLGGFAPFCIRLMFGI